MKVVQQLTCLVSNIRPSRWSGLFDRWAVEHSPEAEKARSPKLVCFVWRQRLWLTTTWADVMSLPVGRNQVGKVRRTAVVQNMVHSQCNCCSAGVIGYVIVGRDVHVAQGISVHAKATRNCSCQGEKWRLTSQVSQFLDWHNSGSDVALSDARSMRWWPCWHGFAILHG